MINNNSLVLSVYNKNSSCAKEVEEKRSIKTERKNGVFIANCLNYLGQR